MFLKQFTLKLIIRIILIILNAIAIAFVVPNIIEGQLMFTFIVLILAIILQIILFFAYLNRSNKLLATFLLAISNKDYTMQFGNEYAETPFKDLTKAFNKILASYRLISKEGESQQQFIEKLVSNMPVGVLIIENNKDINYINDQAKDILGINPYEKWTYIQNKMSDFTNQVDLVETSGEFKYESLGKSGKIIYSVIVHEFYLFDKTYKMIVLQDISKEVESGEIDAMHRLVRILTHEIMNSVTPINSLSETISMLMDNEQGKAKDIKDYSDKNIEDIRESVHAIKDRIEGLEHFVNNFRKLTKTNQLTSLEKIRIKDLIERVSKLMESECQKFRIKLFFDIEDEDMQINIDVKLIEQVLINLLANSFDATSKIDKPEIKINAFKQNSNIYIQIIDNGVGISEEKLNEIFIPFFTTKENGSGIGLSLAKQIMRLHNGTIRATSTPQEETIFTLIF